MEENISLLEAQKVMLNILKEVDRICKKNNIKYWLDSGSLLGGIRHRGFIPWDDDIDIAMLREDFEKFLRIAENELNENYFLQTPETDQEYSWDSIPAKVRDKNSIFIEKWEKIEKKYNGIYIDIFPIDKFSRNKFIRTLEMIPKVLFELKTTEIWTEEKNLKNFIKKNIIMNFNFLIPKKILILVNDFLIKKSKKKKEYVYSYGYYLTWRHIFKPKDIFPLKKLRFEKLLFYCPNNSQNILTTLYKDFMKLPPENKRYTHAKFIKRKEKIE